MAKDLKTIIPSIVKTVSVSSAAKVITPIATAIVGGIPNEIVQAGVRQVANFGINYANNEKLKKHNQTLANWLGLRVNESGYTYQCVAWAKKYVEETFGIRLTSFGGKAYTAWETNPGTFGKQWKKIPYKQGLVPPVGAVVFFKPTQAIIAGHVAIADTGSTSTTLNIIEQNGKGGNNGLGEDAISRKTIPYNQRGGVVGWYTLSGWENVHGNTTDIAYNTQADGVTSSTQQGILANIYANDPQLQKLLNFFEQITGITSGAGVNKTQFKPRTEFEKWMFIDSNKAETEESTEDTKQNIKDNLNGIMIATMLEILKRMLGLPTLQDQLNGANTGTTSSTDSQNTTPQKTTDDGIKTEVAKIPGTYAGTYGESLNKLKGDLRSKASTSGNEFSFKGNNPAGMKFGGNNSQTYKALNFAGVQIVAKNAKVPSGETLSYYVFKTIEDGIKAQRVYWALYILWDKNDAWTEGNPNGSVKHALQHWGTGSLVQDLSFPLETRIKALTEEQISELMVKQLQKESPKLYAYMMSL